MEENEQEVTIRVTLPLNEAKEFLENNGFEKKSEFELNDIYMIPEEFSDIEKYDERRLLNLSVRIRNVIQENISHKEIIKKDKDYDDENRIIKEEKYICRIKDVDEANKLLRNLGYVELFTLKQNAFGYAKGRVEAVLSEINGRVYVEIETNNYEGEKVFDSTNEIIDFIKKYEIPHEKDEYYVQKAIDEIQYLRENK